MLWIRSACVSQCCWRSAFFLSFSSGESVSSKSISVNSLIRSGKTNAFGSSGIQKAAALLGEIGFVRFFVDGEEQFLLEREQFFLARVLKEGQLGLIDRAALVRVFHHAQ